MMLKEGQAVILEKYSENNKRVKSLRGTIEKVYRSYILLDLNNYKECVSLADILDPATSRLRVKEGRQWRMADKSMLDRSLFSDDYIRRPRL